MRITVRVRPGGSRTAVGGTHGEDQLIVRTNAPAVDGRANTAVVAAVAEAFGVSASSVRIVLGQTARSKVLELDVDDENGARILAGLLAHSD